MFDLTNKCALVTGASGGIGSEIAKILHANGATVAISGTRIEPLNDLAVKLGERVFIVPANLSDKESVTKLPKDAEAAMGKIDILINNAGITRDNLTMRMKDDEWDQVINVNLTASFRLCRAVLRGMMKRRWGRIVNISSIVGTTGNPGQINYAASKAGMVGMSKSLGQEVASRGITVNCIAPGFIATSMTSVLSEEQQNKLNAAIPMGRMGNVSDIANGALYLSSEEAAYITGQTLHINGGMAMI